MGKQKKKVTKKKINVRQVHPKPGKKFDAGKLRWGLLPVKATREIVRVLTKGAEKYDAWNWIVVPDARNRYYDALQRHLTAWWEGEKNDPEWDIHHLAHAGCCLLFLLALDLEGRLDEDLPTVR